MQCGPQELPRGGQHPALLLPAARRPTLRPLASASLPRTSPPGAPLRPRAAAAAHVATPGRAASGRLCRCAAATYGHSRVADAVSALQEPGSAQAAAYVVGVPAGGQAGASELAEQVKQLLDILKQQQQQQQQDDLLLLLDGVGRPSAAEHCEQQQVSAAALCSALASAYGLQLEALPEQGSGGAGSGAGARSRLLSLSLGGASRAAAAAAAAVLGAVEGIASAASSAVAAVERRGVSLAADLPDTSLRPRSGYGWGSAEEIQLGWAAALTFCMVIWQLELQGYDVVITSGEDDEGLGGIGIGDSDDESDSDSDSEDDDEGQGGSSGGGGGEFTGWVVRRRGPQRAAGPRAGGGSSGGGDSEQAGGEQAGDSSGSEGEGDGEQASSDEADELLAALDAFSNRDPEQLFSFFKAAGFDVSITDMPPSPGEPSSPPDAAEAEAAAGGERELGLPGDVDDLAAEFARRVRHLERSWEGSGGEAGGGRPAGLAAGEEGGVMRSGEAAAPELLPKPVWRAPGDGTEQDRPSGSGSSSESSSSSSSSSSESSSSSGGGGGGSSGNVNAAASSRSSSMAPEGPVSSSGEAAEPAPDDADATERVLLELCEERLGSLPSLAVRRGAGEEGLGAAASGEGEEQEEEEEDEEQQQQQQQQQEEDAEGQQQEGARRAPGADAQAGGEEAPAAAQPGGGRDGAPPAGFGGAGWEQLSRLAGPDLMSRLGDVLRAGSIRMRALEPHELPVLLAGLKSLQEGDPLSSAELAALLRMLSEAEITPEGQEAPDAGDALRRRARALRRQRAALSRASARAGALGFGAAANKDRAYAQDMRSVRVPKLAGRRRGERTKQLLHAWRRRQAAAEEARALRQALQLARRQLRDNMAAAGGPPPGVSSPAAAAAPGAAAAGQPPALFGGALQRMRMALQQGADDRWQEQQQGQEQQQDAAAAAAAAAAAVVQRVRDALGAPLAASGRRRVVVALVPLDQLQAVEQAWDLPAGAPPEQG